MSTASARHAAQPLPPMDRDRRDAFAECLLTMINDAATTLMISIGHRTGLFDAMSDGGWRTSSELARATGASERYVREWLAAMAVSGVAEFDQIAERYRLPPEHADLLSRRGSENFAVVAQYIPLLGAVEDDVVHCFREGGGVPYDRFGRFHEVMAEDSAATVVAALHDHIVPLVPGLAGRLESGIRALDLGCGRGLALLELAARYPASEFHGYDLSETAIAFARGVARARGLANVHVEARDLSDFDVTADPHAFDLVTTFDAVHDQARPGALLRGIARTLRPAGVYLMQDIHASSHLYGNMDHPLGPLFYTVSCLHCMTVSLAQGGEGLGTMWGRELAERMLREAGFTSIEVHRLPHDIQNDYYVVRR